MKKKRKIVNNGASLRVVQRFFPNVERVVDATESQAIEVTPEDARSKGTKDHATCAMAVACKRSLHLDGVIISRSTAYLVKGKQARRFMVCGSISRELTSFDRGGSFAPGKYHLSAVPKSRKMGINRGSSHTETGMGKKPKYRHITKGIRAVLGGAEDGD